MLDEADRLLVGGRVVEAAVLAGRAVGEAGGTTVSERQPVGEMGFTAYFKDTEGNLVGLWETAKPA